MDTRVPPARGWYLFDGRARLGPMSAGELTSALLQLPNPRRGLVWREDLPAWTEAGALPELAAALPPAPAPPPAATIAPARGAPTGAPAHPVDELEATASLYRQVVLLVGALLLCGFGVVLVAGRLPPFFSAFVMAAGQLVVLGLWVVMSVLVFRLATRLELTAPAAWAIATWVPLVNLVVLAMLSRAAQSWCARYGVPFGLLGPARGSLDWMRD